MINIHKSTATQHHIVHNDVAMMQMMILSKLQQQVGMSQQQHAFATTTKRACWRNISAQTTSRNGINFLAVLMQRKAQSVCNWMTIARQFILFTSVFFVQCDVLD